MGKEEIVRKVSFRVLRSVVGVAAVANGMNGVVYVGVQCHVSWINHVEKVNEVSCCMKRRGAG